MKLEKDDQFDLQYRLGHVSSHSAFIAFSKDKVNNMVEYQKVLKECTSNENWNISNSKLQILADHSFNW